MREWHAPGTPQRGRPAPAAVERKDDVNATLHDPSECKTRAAGPARRHCSTLVQPVLQAVARPLKTLRRRLAGLGLAGVAATAALHGAAAAPAPAACPGPALRIERLAPGLWWVPAAAGDATAANRGQVSNLLLARDGARLWLLGSGPSPAFGRALACQVKAQLGRAVTDVVSPWPRPELVLGIAGLGAVRSWAHEDVAEAMRHSCPGCVERLRVRMAAAEPDLGTDPVRVPTQRVHGAQGRLGPWRWWRQSRGEGYPVTVWQHAAHRVGFAPGLLWGAGVADARDADIETLVRSTRALLALPPVRSWLGEQGGPLSPDAPASHLAYWRALADAVNAAQARGDIDTGQPAVLPGLDAASREPQHALNWQRAWRQAEAWAEAQELAAAQPGAPAASSADGAGRWLQRSLR